MPDDPKPQPAQKPYGGPTIVALHVTSGDTLTYDEYIDVEYDKPDTNSDAHLILRCSNSTGHDHSDDHTIPAMLPNGIESFHLTHTSDYPDPGVTIRVTIRQNGNEDYKEATNIKIGNGMYRRGEEAARAPLPMDLNPAIERPIRFVRGQVKVLVGTYRPVAGDYFLLCLYYDAQKPTEIPITPDPCQDGVCTWSVKLRPRDWAQGGQQPRNVRLVVMKKDGSVVYGKTFSAVVLCGRNEPVG